MLPNNAQAFPLRFRGDLDEPLSRGLWLVKWFLAIPHLVVLLFLHIARFVLTVIAGFAILFTGRYPRSMFDFNLGVLRWSWRVSFYAFTLGTDKYPPFSLAPNPEYPADLELDYPERLSQGLVVVKWWLLAIPHYLLIAGMAGGGIALGSKSSGTTIPLLGLLILVAAVALLFTARYPRGLFAFVLGISRWIYRVHVYASLMTDVYPPFRLDMGPREPGDEAAGLE